jgi:hypothetical protein
VIQQDEKVITIDDLLIADTFIARIDEAMSQFEVRSEYSRQMGDALAQTYDRNLLSLAVKAARDTGAGGIGVGAVGQGNATSQHVGATPTIRHDHRRCVHRCDHVRQRAHPGGEPLPVR